MFDNATVSLSMMLKLGFIAVTALVALIAFLKGRKLRRSVCLARKISGPSLWKIATVHARHLISHTKFIKHLFEMSVNYDYKPWCFRKGLDLVVVISDPDTIGAAFKSKNLQKKEPNLYNALADHVGLNSLVLNGPEWKIRRTLTSPAFNKTNLEPLLDVMYEEALRCTKKIIAEAGESEFCIEDAAKAGILYITLRSLAARDTVFDQKLVDDVIWFEMNMMSSVQMKYANIIRYWFMYLFDRARVRKITHGLRLVRSMIRIEKSKILHRINLGVPVDNTAITFLLESCLKPNVLSEEEIICEVLFLTGASLDTTSTVLAAAVYMLALHPNVQIQAAEEIRNIFGDSDRPVVSEDLSQMQYLERVIKETVRLFPPGGFIWRRTDDNTNLNGTVIPEGSSVLFNLYALHRNPNVFKDPLKFDPDRFSPGAQEGRHPYAFLPFSSGMRNCPGRLHAMMMLKTVLSTFLRHFKVLPCRGMNSIEDIKTKLTFTMAMNGNYIRVISLRGAESQ